MEIPGSVHSWIERVGSCATTVWVDFHLAAGYPGTAAGQFICGGSIARRALKAQRPLVRCSRMNERATSLQQRSARPTARVESVLLQHTDVLVARRRVLAIAPETALFDTLESHGQLERRYLARASAVALRAEAGYDVIVADARRGGAGEREGLRELTRALRPGGRLIVAGAASCGGMLRRRLEAAGLLVALAACDERTHVLVAVRPAGGQWVVRGPSG